MSRRNSMLLIIDAQQGMFPDKVSASVVRETVKLIAETTDALRGQMHIGWAVFCIPAGDPSILTPSGVPCVLPRDTRMAERHAQLITLKPDQFAIWKKNDRLKGADLLDGIVPKNGDVFVPKRRLSALHNQSFLNFLRAQRIENLYVGGFYTGACVAQTCLDADRMARDKKLFPNGLNVQWVSDLSHERLVPTGMEGEYSVRLYMQDFSQIARTNCRELMAKAEPQLPTYRTLQQTPNLVS